MSNIKNARDAAIARTNLYMFDAVVQLMESSCRPQGRSAVRAAERIIAICKTQEQIELRAFDRAIGKLAP